MSTKKLSQTAVSGQVEAQDHKCSLFPFEREDVLTLQEAKQQAGWSISAFDLPQAWRLTQGEGVKVAVLDSGCDLDHPDLADNLLPGINYVKKGKPPQDDNGHGCIDPDCLVHTNFCGIEKISKLYHRIPVREITSKHGHIKDIRNLGIKTYSIQDDKTVIGEVEFLHRTPINGKVIHITLEGGIDYKLTPWHPIYVKQLTNGRRSIIRKKRADKLIIGDKLLFAQGENAGRLVQDLYRIDGKEYKQCLACGHIPRCFRKIATKCKKCGKNTWEVKNRTYLVNTEFAWLIGLIVSDGHVNPDNRRVEISSITDEILQKALTVSIKLGFGGRLRSDENRLLINSTDLIVILTNLGIKSKKKSYEQHLPEFVGKSPKEIICAFLAGVIDGDGCVSKTNTKNRITTVSSSLAYGLAALLNSVGVSCGVTSSKNIYKGIENANYPILNCTFSAILPEISKHIAHPVKAKRSRTPVTTIRNCRRIRNIQITSYNGDFYDFTVKDAHTYLANGHFVSNTHATGIICAENNDIGVVGVAPESKVIPVKVLDRHGNGSLENVALGIRWAVQQGADIISMSLGAPTKLQQVRKAIQFAAKKGIPTFVAAGNAGRTKKVFYPAAYPETIAIGSINEEFDRSSFSNTGRNLDFMAPGSRIMSTVPDDWYAIMTGTSMACPWAVGVAALILSFAKAKKLKVPLKTVEDYRKVFRKHTTPINNKAWKDKKFYQGFGIIDPRKLLKDSLVTG